MKYFGIARGSGLECAAIHDVLLVGKALGSFEVEKGEKLLIRIVSMLTKMTEKLGLFVRIHRNTVASITITAALITLTM